MALKKIPMRMCVACRQMRPKQELLRMVRNAEGTINIDTTGKASGRGAYLCKDIVCLEKAMKTKALERAFEQKIAPETFELLKKEMEQYV